MSDESLFREVDEEVRQEQFQKLWKQYGGVVMAACLVVILAVAGFKGWQYWKLQQAEAAGITYFEAVKLGEGGKTEDEIKALAALDDSGYGQLARLRQAAALAASGQRSEAVAAYDAIIAAAVTDPAIRDLARIRAGYILADTLKPSELGARLTGLDAAASPWRHETREILAFSAFRTADYAAADRYANEIVADLEAPPGNRQRARLLLQLLAPLLGKPAAS